MICLFSFINSISAVSAKGFGSQQSCSISTENAVSLVHLPIHGICKPLCCSLEIVTGSKTNHWNRAAVLLFTVNKTNKISVHHLLPPFSTRSVFSKDPFPPFSCLLVSLHQKRGVKRCRWLFGKWTVAWNPPSRRTVWRTERCAVTAFEWPKREKLMEMSLLVIQARPEEPENPKNQEVDAS